MNKNLLDMLRLGAGGYVAASLVTAGRVKLVRIGAYDEVRHRYNQIACLVGATAVQKLSTFPPAGGQGLSTTSEPPHYWLDSLSGDAPVDSAGALFQLAAQGPSQDADKVGYLAFHDQWPQDMWRLPGMPPMRKSLSQALGRVFYDFTNYPAVRIATPAETTVIRRAREGIEQAKQLGFGVYDEPGLEAFLRTLVTARALQFIHEADVSVIR